MLSSNPKRDLQKAVERAAEAGVKDVAGQYQRVLDEFARKYKGRPVAEVKGPLRIAWKRIGGDITDLELTKYAEIISAGGTIKMTVGKPRW